MEVLSKKEAIVILVVFGLSMIALVWGKSSSNESTESFLAGNREIPFWKGAFSIAVSWIWAPAIFICSMQSYTQGLPGIFWFTFPNILCFFIFAPLALKLRKLMPQGYTFPEFIFNRFNGNRRLHLVYLLVFFGYQLGAIVINTVAGGTLLHSLSGLDINLSIVMTSMIALTYSLISGLRASILTDTIQMLLVLLVGIVLVPWCLIKAGGIEVINTGLGGATGEYRSILNPWIAFTLGIPMTLGLISGPICDQMFFQRALAVREKVVFKTFVAGGILFSIVPITLSLLGFIGADLNAKGLIEVSDPQMIGPAVISHLLPKAALYGFCFMAFAGLCSTMDSAFCAGSSLGSIDLYKRYINPDATDKELLRSSRLSMTTLALIGTTLALLQPKLLWVFLIYGALASSAMAPTILALYWKKLPASNAFWAILTALLVGVPLSIYANIKEDPYLIVTSTVFNIFISSLIALLKHNKTPKTRRRQLNQLKNFPSS